MDSKSCLFHCSSCIDHLQHTIDRMNPADPPLGYISWFKPFFTSGLTYPFGGTPDFWTITNILCRVSRNLRWRSSLLQDKLGYSSKNRRSWLSLHGPWSWGPSRSENYVSLRIVGQKRRHLHHWSKIMEDKASHASLCPAMAMGLG